ncbi:MAG: serine--tRNA ligase [Acidobacteria bacterium 13_1_40CM_56_16]|nr:MAG: serine--tRNA ligase [Acidobacteria bacterium 13_1_40CM_56_16]
MLDLNYLRENIETARRRLAGRGFLLDVETFQRLDGERKNIIYEVERLRQRRNSASEDIAKLLREKVEVTDKRNEMKLVSQQIKDKEDALRTVEGNLFQFAATIPNLPDPAVPVGPTDEQNVEVRRAGDPPRFDFPPKAHWDLCPPLGILDLDRATKIAGSRFPLLAGMGARLERALINFMLDIHTNEHGYKEVLPPFMANSDSLFGTSNLPKFEGDLFKVRDTDYYLVPTAEVPVTNIYREDIIDGERLPIKFTACTPCFRSEAGSYGKDVRGIFRQHQFNKVELVKFTRPEDSNAELESLVAAAEEILKRLKLAYRVVIHSTGDMGFAASKSYDIEVWLPGQDNYREISSCSNFEDFQARRANIRYRPSGGGKVRFVHTLNGSGLAIGRTWIAIMENYQQKDGTVVIPEALRPYVGGQSLIRPETII